MKTAQNVGRIKRITLHLFEKLKTPEVDVKSIKDRIFNLNMPLARKIAYKYKGRRQNSADDIEQEAMKGLWIAIETYNIDLGFAFATHAQRQISGKCLDFLKGDHLIHIPTTVLSKFEKAQRSIEKGMNEDQVCKELDIKKKDLIVFNQTRGWVSDNVLEEKEKKEDKTEEQIDDILTIVNKLPCRERLIIKMRYMEDKTLAEVGQELGLTGSRVCQIEKEVLKKIKNRVLV